MTEHETKKREAPQPADSSDQQPLKQQRPAAHGNGERGVAAAGDTRLTPGPTLPRSFTALLLVLLLAHPHPTKPSW